VSTLPSKIRSRLWPEHTEGQSGFTLAEMVVAISILGVVLAMVMTMTISAQRSLGGNIARLDQVQQGRLAIESMTKTLRTAVRPTQLNATCTGCDQSAFLQGDGRRVQFYANINNPSNIIGPSRVAYTVNASGNLIETIQPPNAHAANDYNYQYCTPGPTCPITTRTIARGVPASATLFTYYDSQGVPFSSLPLSTTDLPRVDSMDVQVVVQRSSQVAPATFIQRVTLPNADAVSQTTPSP
jgi:prepilin-type N-terminal cleavage/methylation domain-containing protein